MKHEKRFPLVNGDTLVVVAYLETINEDSRQHGWFDSVHVVDSRGDRYHLAEQDLITDRIKETYAEAYESIKPEILK